MGNHTEHRLTEVENLAQDWATAELYGDTVFLGQVLADDFVGVEPYGFMLTKDEWLERNASGKLKYDSLALDETRVRLYGDAAVVIGRETAEGRYEDGEIRQEIREKLRATMVFVKDESVRDESRWLLAGIHMSLIADGGGRAAS